MVFINFRHVFLTLMFVIGAVTLFIGYNGITGMLIEKPSGIKETVESIAPEEPGQGRQSPGSGREEKAGTAYSAGAAAKDSFFVEYRLQREKTRGQQIELLREILDSPSTTGETRQVAQEQLLIISRSVARETRVENLLKARGYNDAVVCIDQKGVSVVVDCGSLSPAEEGEIVGLVSRETGFGEQGIVIIPKA
jgi:stage III sporulation protein AH